jgi:hypothetical protein
VLKTLEAALEEYPPRSLDEITAEIGYSNSRHLRRIAPDLCKRLYRNYADYMKGLGRKFFGQRVVVDVEIVRKALDEAAEQDNPPALDQLASKLGVSVFVLKKRCPNLCEKINAKRARFTSKRFRAIEKTLKKALDEEPPPCFREVLRRCGVHDDALKLRYPQLCVKIKSRHETWKEGRRSAVQEILEAAAKENPPRPLTSIAKQHGLDYNCLHSRFPGPCHAITERYREHVKASKAEKLKLFKEQLKAAANALWARGLYPSIGRIRSLRKKLAIQSYMITNRVLKEVRDELGIMNRMTRAY